MQNDKLKALGRIHDSGEAIKAAEQAQSAGLNSFNLDLMHGLPGQSLEDALGDLEKIIALKPKHISWYQLTIEENTQFHSRPPKLPEDDALWDIQEQGHLLLQEAGYQQYEISGYSLEEYQCQHNLNYWRFGDYLGIGCGAHGKITLPVQNKILRTVKIKHPKGYMAPSETEQTKSYLFNKWSVAQDELPFEFFMNRLRLFEAFNQSEFSDLTGLPLKVVDQAFDKAKKQGLIAHSLTQNNAPQWQVTAKGHRYLNDLLELFV
jgi:oxygen-independent coproporphyrinogen-3 oxidase